VENTGRQRRGADIGEIVVSSSASISRSRMPIRLETPAGVAIALLHSRSMLARDAPVSAVSLAAKNAETRRQATTIRR